MTLYGGKTTPFLQGDALLTWVNGKGTAVADAADTFWLLAHCDDGVVWGKWSQKQNHWLLSNVEFAEYGKVSPEITQENLQQLRVFGSQREVLIWRTDDGFGGRVLIDTEESFEAENPLRPKDECHILVGDRLLAGPVGEFSLVGDGRGARHVIPLECKKEAFKKGERTQWPLRLVVKHYLTQDGDTGVVRIAVSRLVDVKDVTKEKK